MIYAYGKESVYFSEIYSTEMNDLAELKYLVNLKKLKAALRYLFGLLTRGCRKLVDLTPLREWKTLVKLEELEVLIEYMIYISIVE